MKPNSEKYQYLRLARKRFLSGTGCLSPERAVAKGERSIEQWAAVVREELELQAKAVRRSVNTAPVTTQENASV